MALRNVDAAVMEKVADHAQPFLEVDELGRSSAQAINRPIAGAHADDGAAAGDFIQRCVGARRDRRIAVDHVGHRGAEADGFRVDGAQRHGLVGIDVVHLAVGEKDRLEAEGFGAFGALDGFVHRARRTM